MFRIGRRKAAIKGLKRFIAFVAIFISLTHDISGKQGNIELGKAVYKEECTICHGSSATGDGPAARFLSPKPRDFTTGVFKLRTTMTLPTDEDLFLTISEGIPGTLMPSFGYLSDEERWALVSYVKTLSEEFQFADSLERVTVGDPPPLTDELLASGKESYDLAKCFECHGPMGKGDGPAAAGLKDDWGNPIVPYDFTIPGRMKGGSTVQDIYRTLVVGVGGTPMPAYYPALREEQLWTIAYYVRSLAQPGARPELEGDPALGRDLVMGATRFENGGPPCIGCHSVMGIGASGGGPYGPELTLAHQKFGEDGLTTFLETIPFPTMGPLFRPRPVTEEERGHLLAFLRGMQYTGVRTVVPPRFILAISIAFAGVVSLTTTGLIAARKKVEVRK